MVMFQRTLGPERVEEVFEALSRQTVVLPFSAIFPVAAMGSILV